MPNFTLFLISRVKRFTLSHIISVLLLLPTTGPAQNTTARIHYIVNQKPVEYYKVNAENLNRALAIPMAFNNDRLPSLEIDLRTHLVTKVQLVYTSYVQRPDFDQKELNRQRLQNFSRAYPELFSNEMINWELVAQTGCNSPESCRDYFHGFIIHYRPPPDSMSTEIEINKIAAMMDEVDSVLERSKTQTLNYTVIWNMDEYEMAMRFKKKLLRKAKCLNESESTSIDVHFNQGREIERITIEPEGDSCALVIWQTIEEYFQSHHKWWNRVVIDGKSTMAYLNIQIHKDPGQELWHKNVQMTVLPDEKDWAEYLNKGGNLNVIFDQAYHKATERIKQEIDSTVLCILERNTSWQDMLIVQDVTASMFPYTLQTLVWHKLNHDPDKTSYFVFFNDGDRKPQHLKKTGQAGGIYGSKARDYEDVESLVFSTMRKGSGGDIKENNMEALIKAIEMCPDCKDVIMIADNLAPPRDISLMAQVNRPVKIILCGTFDGINPVYLDFARINGGTVHTIEADIEGLAKINEGQTIRIGRSQYILSGGQFRRLYH